MAGVGVARTASIDVLSDAEATHVLRVAPLDVRAFLACTSRRWARLSREDSLWLHLSLRGLPTVLMSVDALTALLRRAGGRLRRLDVGHAWDYEAEDEGDEDNDGVDVDRGLPDNTRLENGPLERHALRRSAGYAQNAISRAADVLAALRAVPAAADALLELRMRAPWSRREGTYLSGMLDLEGLRALRRQLCPNLVHLSCAFEAPVPDLPEALALLPPAGSTALRSSGAADFAAAADGAEYVELPQPLLNEALQACAARGGARAAPLFGMSLRLNGPAAAVLGEALQDPARCAHVTHLMLRECGIRGAEVAPLGAALASAACSVSWLSLRSCSLKLEGARALAPGLAASRRLRALGLMNTGITSAGVAVVARALAANTSLTALNLRTTHGKLDAAQALAALLLVHPRLAVLTLTNSKVGDAGAAALGAALAERAAGRLGSQLAALHVDNSGIRVAGARELLRASTCRLSALTQLDLSRNKDVGEAALAPLLAAQAPSLRDLNLSSCGIEVAGAEALARALTCGHLPRLARLRVADCSLGDHGVAHLALALSTAGAASLELLYLSANDAGPAACAALRDALAAPAGVCRLRVLKLGNNDLGDDGAASLAAGLAVNTRLESLALEATGIGAPGVVALCAAIEKNTRSALRALSLWNHDPDAVVPGAGAAAAHGLAPLLGARRTTLCQVSLPPVSAADSDMLRAAVQERSLIYRAHLDVDVLGDGED